MYKELYLDKEQTIKCSIFLQGNILVAYTLRLWKLEDNNVKLIDEIRGSCFNNTSSETIVNLANISGDYSNYNIELVSNINTVNSLADYSIRLLVINENSKGNKITLGDLNSGGFIGFSDGGQFKTLGFHLCPTLNA